MKSWNYFVSGICVLFLISICGSVRGQDPAPSSANVTAPISSNPSSPDPSNATSRPVRPGDSFVIGDDDVLSINVWKEPELSKQIPVRSDGKISLPLAGDLQASGRTPSQLAQDITTKLKNYITDPEVTVIVEQINSRKFNMIGQVGRPGSYPLNVGTTIMDAIAAAGGLRDFAKKKSIYILRQNASGTEQRIPFNYEKFIKGNDPSQNILLKPHDTIVVP